MKRICEPVERRAGLGVDDFLETYLRPELPVVLTDMTADWRASERWSVDELTARYGDYPIRGYYHPEGLYTAWSRMRLDTTLGAILNSDDPRTFASADFFPDCPYLIDDIAIPRVVRPEWVEDQSSLWIQPRGHRTGLHWDSFSSMISVIRGRKRVLMFSPDQFERLYPCAVTGSRDFTLGSWSRLDVFAPDYEAYPAARDAQYHEVFVEPGETLLIPRHYWHAVENLGTPTIAVSFFIAAQGKPELTFYHDRRIIAGLSIKVGVLTGERAPAAHG